MTADPEPGSLVMFQALKFTYVGVYLGTVAAASYENDHVIYWLNSSLGRALYSSTFLTLRCTCYPPR